jgi:DeoR/GlpR family transcriptional regulator of sugar metabolism
MSRIDTAAGKPPLLANQRHEAILSELASQGGVRVTELAPRFGVTEETIRRDLEKLGREGKLIRTHGGAVPLSSRGVDLPFDIRQTENLGLKEQIARHAVQSIEPHDVIALDASSTVHQVTRALPDIPLTIVTNALPATVRLWSQENVRVVATGGILDRPSRSWVGSFAEQALERLNITKFFLSSVGLDPQRGLSEIDDAQARVKRLMMDLAEQTFLLLDHTKLGVRATVALATLDEIDRVIVDSATPADWQATLRAHHDRIEIAGEE